jgi:hypothetical protein
MDTTRKGAAFAWTYYHPETASLRLRWHYKGFPRRNASVFSYRGFIFRNTPESRESRESPRGFDLPLKKSALRRIF